MYAQRLFLHFVGYTCVSVSSVLCTKQCVHRQLIRERSKTKNVYDLRGNVDHFIREQIKKTKKKKTKIIQKFHDTHKWSSIKEL